MTKRSGWLLAPWLLAPAILLGASHAASACRGTNVVLTADAYDPASVSDLAKKAPNEFEIHPPADRISTHGVMKVPDTAVSVCAELSMVSTSDPSDSGVGVIFWMASDDNYYFFELTANGKYRVVHVLSGKWYQLVPYTESAAIVKGLDKWNDVELTPGDGSMDIWINGQKIDSVIARRIGDAGLYGLFGESPKSAGAVMLVRNLRLVKLGS